jgi:hypothetical protein
MVTLALFLSQSEAIKLNNTINIANQELLANYE